MTIKQKLSKLNPIGASFVALGAGTGLISAVGMVEGALKHNWLPISADSVLMNGTLVVAGFGACVIGSQALQMERAPDRRGVTSVMPGIGLLAVGAILGSTDLIHPSHDAVQAVRGVWMSLSAVVCGGAFIHEAVRPLKPKQDPVLALTEENMLKP